MTPPFELSTILSHPLSSGVPTWHGGRPDYELTTVVDYHQCTTQTKFRAQRVSFATGLSTHIDAPAHCIPHGKTVDQLDQSRFIAPLVVINVANKAKEFYQITTQDILDFERTHGRIANGSLVCFQTGWSRFWDSPPKYQHFPALSAEAAALIITRSPVGVGIDTHSVDILRGKQFPAHEIILGHGCYIIENLTNLEKIPAMGTTAIVAPLVLAGATETPVRVLALPLLQFP